MEKKFLYNGIKIDGKFYKGTYRTHENRTIYFDADSYKHLPLGAGLIIKNDTDSMTDYFDTDRAIFPVEHPDYNEVKQALIAFVTRHANRQIARCEKQFASGIKQNVAKYNMESAKRHLAALEAWLAT